MQFATPKAAKRIPTFVREREMDRLFAYYPFGDDYAGHRDRTLLLLLYHTGLRAAEVLGLDLSGVDLTAGQLRVTGKGNKQRIVPFGAELREAIADYLPVREAYLRGFSVDESALFLSVRGKRLGYTALRNIVRARFQQSPVSKRNPPRASS